MVRTIVVIFRLSVVWNYNLDVAKLICRDGSRKLAAVRLEA